LIFKSTDIARLRHIYESVLLPEEMASLLLRIQDGTLSNHLAKQVFADMWEHALQRRKRIVKTIEEGRP
jgi:Asp-tRNA(Asn)/Glu-tRNA(Gln) amidotransferase B subunit